MDRGAVGREVPPHPFPLIGRRGIERHGPQSHAFLRRHDIELRHRKETVAGVAVARHGCLIDIDDLQGIRIGQPHRHRIGVEHQAKAGFAGLEFGDVAQGDEQEVVEGGHAALEEPFLRSRADADREVGVAAPRSDGHENVFDAVGSQVDAEVGDIASEQIGFRKPHHPGGAGIEADDLEAGDPRIRIAGRRQHHDAVPGRVKDALRQAERVFGFIHVEQDELRPPAGCQRQGDQILDGDQAVLNAADRTRHGNRRVHGRDREGVDRAPRHCSAGVPVWRCPGGRTARSARSCGGVRDPPEWPAGRPCRLPNGRGFRSRPTRRSALRRWRAEPCSSGPARTRLRRAHRTGHRPWSMLSEIPNLAPLSTSLASRWCEAFANLDRS